MRVPLVYTATEIVNWHVSEPAKTASGWRPARQCGFWDWTHIRQQFRVAWKVFIGELDALNWEDGSGTGKAPEEYLDCRDPRWIKSTRMTDSK